MVRELIGLGLPASLQLLAEVSAFVMVTLLIGTLAGRAGFASGGDDLRRDRFHGAARPLHGADGADGRSLGRGSICAPTFHCSKRLGLALAFTACSALGFLFNHTIAGWFLTEPKAAALTASLLLISAAFQVSDAMQVSSGGALRGLGDVKVPVWVAFVAYWIIAIPVGWL